MDMIGWLVAFVILIGIEAATMALTTIWFAGGAVFAFFAAVLGFFHTDAACGVPDRIVYPASLYKTARHAVRQPGNREDER